MLNSEIHTEGELNKPNIKFIENLPEFISHINDIDKNNIEEIDNFLWSFTRQQLITATKNLKTKEEITNYLNNNVNMSDLFKPEVLQNMINDKMAELVENGIDMTNKSLIASISLGMDMTRKIELKLVDNPNVSQYGFQDFNNDLPDFNPVIKSQIETVCKEMLYGHLNDEELKDFIEERCEEYREEPFTIDWLEGFIEGFLSEYEEDE